MTAAPAASEAESLRAEVERLRESLTQQEQELAHLRDLRDKSAADSQWWEQRCRHFEDKWRAWSWEDYFKDVSIASPLTEFVERLSKPVQEGLQWRWYLGSCPCCRRPLEVTVSSESQDELAFGRLGIVEYPRFAYCCALWGANAGYALGAAVLGARLRELSDLDRILLHTDDVPQNYLSILAEVWTLQEVDYIDGVEALYSCKGTNFDGVFTKLNAWKLVQYDKVLLLDVDTIPLQPLDSIFELETPAALVRGNGDLAHGEATDGRRFFAPGGSEEGCWGQSGGINAGVILLRPCEHLFSRMLYEVTSPAHPAHIAGPGPEQDYLTRFFAADRRFPWHHIDVGWNYQLHHMLFALEHVIQWREHVSKQDTSWASALDRSWVPRRLTIPKEDIRIVHFSGDLKLWHMHVPVTLRPEQTDSVDAAEGSKQELGGKYDEDHVFAERLISNFTSYDLWMARDASAEGYAEFGCAKSDDGRITLLSGDEDVTDFVNDAVQQVRDIAVTASAVWRQCSERLMAEQPDLLGLLLRPSVPEGCFPVGSKVEVQWQPHPGNIQWLSGRIFSVHASGRYAVKFDQGGHWGNLERQVEPQRVRKLQDAVDEA